MNIPKALSVFRIANFCFDPSDTSLLKTTSSQMSGSTRSLLSWESFDSNLSENCNNPITFCYKTATSYVMLARDTRNKPNPALVKQLAANRIQLIAEERRVSSDERKTIEDTVKSDLSATSSPKTTVTAVYIFPQISILAIASKNESDCRAIVKHLKNTIPSVGISPAWSQEYGHSGIMVDVMTNWIKSGLPIGLKYGSRIAVARGSEVSTFENFNIEQMDPSFLKGRDVQNIELCFNGLLAFRLCSKQILTHLKATPELKQQFLEHVGSIKGDIHSTTRYLADNLYQMLSIINGRMLHEKGLVERRANSEQASAWVHPSLRV
ncbi:recombination-associated protein RdgC [Porticoccaceae bacterium]|nr:recombination-associated protein RdgC [Porticoccaceae bacterium]MDA8663466.1 recombination-associated protein RdgC [Porticoccaceae bacterium]